MRQVITTKYLPPTNFRGARIKATCAAGSLTVNYQPWLYLEDNHKNAARLLIAQLGWNKPEHLRGSQWYGGLNEKGHMTWTHAVPSALLEL